MRTLPACRKHAATCARMASARRLPLPLQQTAGRVFLEAPRLVYLAVHGAVVAPAALALDGLEIGAGPVCAGGHATAQAVAR